MSTEAKNLTVYCHFSFKRPKSKKGIGYFAVAFYSDACGKNLIAQKTVERMLWEDHQFITAIQSYSFALSFIYQWQGVMVGKGISHVMLVTDNSTLAGWIEDPNKNKTYTEYMMKAITPHRVGAEKEIILGIGLCDVVNYEKSYKYCKEEYISDCDKVKTKSSRSKKVRKVMRTDDAQYRSIYDMMEDDISDIDIE